MKKLLVVFLFIFLMLPHALINAEERSKEERLVTALELLEDYEDGSFRGDAYVTNQEFAAALYKMLGAAPAANWDGIVSELTDRGVLFNKAEPKEAVSADEAVFAMVRLLGYKDENYKKTASDNGLYKGVNFKDGYVTRSTFSKLVYNTLLAERVVLSEISGDKLVFEKKGSLLEDVFGVKRVVGIVGADYSAYITEPSYSLAKGEMMIDDVIVSGSYNTKDYLGRRVEAFLKFEENSEKNAEALVIDTYKTDEVKATSEFIDGATTSTKLVWLDSDSDKLKQKAIPKDAVVIYNGKRIGTAAGQEWSLFTPGDGEVNLIDNDGDGDAEVVIIWSYIPYIVDYVNTANEMIFDKSGRETVFLEEREYSVYDADGTAIDLSQLKPFDVLSIAFGLSGEDEIIIRRSSKKPVSGVYTRDGYSILIGGDEYSLGGWCSLDGISNGDRVTIYLDMYDRPVYIVKQSVYEYGYMSKIIFDFENEDRIYIKLYSFDEGAAKYELDDTVSVYYGREKVKYYRNKSGEDNSFGTLYGLIKDRQELIKFKRNSKGYIKEILFPSSKIWQDTPDTKDGFDMYYGWENDGSPSFREGKFLQNMFASRYRVTSNTKVLSLEGNPSEPEKFVRLSASDLVGDNDYNVIIYDVNDRYEAGAVIVDNVTDWYSKFGSIVEKVSTVSDEDGNEILQFSVYTLGEQKTLLADNLDLVSDRKVAEKFKNDGVKLSEIGVGDVIYYKLNSEGKIAAFAVLHKNEPEAEFYHRSNYGWEGNYIPNAAMAVTYCKVTKTYSDLIIADIDGTRPIGEYAWRNYYIYEKSKNRITKAGFSDVKPGDKIVGLWKWSNMNDLIIYR